MACDDRCHRTPAGDRGGAPGDALGRLGGGGQRDGGPSHRGAHGPGAAGPGRVRSSVTQAMAGLHETDVDPDPIEQFLAWYRQADAEAVALATASAEGVPSVRMVLLRGADQNGFVFYTNYDSAKARDLAVNPRAALCFFWPPDRQVRVSGPVETLGTEESEPYWRNRPRASQLSAWASRQSQVVESREALEQRVAELADRFGEEDVPL